MTIRLEMRRWMMKIWTGTMGRRAKNKITPRAIEMAVRRKWQTFVHNAEAILKMQRLKVNWGGILVFTSMNVSWMLLANKGTKWGRKEWLEEIRRKSFSWERKNINWSVLFFSNLDAITLRICRLSKSVGTAWSHWLLVMLSSSAKNRWKKAFSGWMIRCPLNLTSKLNWPLIERGILKYHR